MPRHVDDWLGHAKKMPQREKVQSLVCNCNPLGWCFPHDSRPEPLGISL